MHQLNFLESLASNAFVISAVVPFIITLMASIMNWQIHGGRISYKHGLIGSDLLLAFSATAAVHFFMIYRQNALSPMDGMKMANLMTATFMMSLMTLPLLLVCIGMERASHVDNVPVTFQRMATNILLGAAPLIVAALVITS